MTEEPPSGPPPYPPLPGPPPPYSPPPEPGWTQQPPALPSWTPGPPMGPPMGPPWGPPPAKKSRTGVVLAILAAVVVLAVAIVVPFALLGGGDDNDDQAGPANLDEVKTYAGQQPTHVPLGQLVTYDVSPPVGGNHWSEWLDCGAYDGPVLNENAVHDLEHGAVWITYDPDLDADDVAALADLLPQNGIMSPYENLRAPVVITVWGRQLDLTGADDPRIALFIEEFDDGVTAPEAYASCAGGTAVGPPTA